MSDGRIVIEFDSSDAHKKTLNILELVRGGEYERGHTASYYSKGMGANLWSGLPLTMMLYKAFDSINYY